VLRTSWDLGLTTDASYRVILNNTTSAAAKVTAKFNLADVNAADTIGVKLTIDQLNPMPSDFSFFDDVAGDLTKTVIPAVSATDASNPVIILNRGTGGTAARPWIKLRVLRNGTNGYTIQYAGITETTFKTFNVTKNDDHHFTFASLTTGTTVSVEPEKKQWDIVWGYSQFQTNFGSMVPYNFSDLIAVNYLAGVTVKEKIYANATAATAAFDAFNKDSLATNTTLAGRWTIGSSWRTSSPPPAVSGVKKDRFYLIKDANGNYYKLKALSFHGDEAGTRGKPEFSYKLIQQ